MRVKTTMLMAATVLGFSNPALADTTVGVNSSVNLDSAVKVDTQTDVVTDKVYNNDGEIVATQTIKTVTDTYKFDTNQNGILDEDEYIAYSYTMIDHDGDGIIDEVEWNNYTTIWYQPVNVKPRSGTFASYDLNGDGYIDATEYQLAYDADLYRAWDHDQDGTVRISDYERMTTTYRDLDSDGLYKWVTMD